MNTRKRRYVSVFRNSQRNRTRDEILAHATALLRQHGPESLTFEHLAQRSGVSLRTVFRHFPSRALLLRTVIDAATPPRAPQTGTLQDISKACFEHSESLGSLAHGSTLSDEAVREIARLLNVHWTSPLAVMGATLLSPAVWHLLRARHALTAEQAEDCLRQLLDKLSPAFSEPPPVVIEAEEEDEFID